MTYQPLNHKSHFLQTYQVFELLFQYSDDTYSEEELLQAADELVHIGNGKVTAEKIREYSQRPNFYSHDTFEMISNRPWISVPFEYEYDEETDGNLDPYSQRKVNFLRHGVANAIC